jgi:hypothetical protein
VPFLRFSRDKRGYEHTYLVQATNRRGKSVRPRILYWYRTPPGVLVGRKPFDESVRSALEAQNPGVVFDWVAIEGTPFPAPEAVEPWRERRRAERAARQAKRDGEEGEPASEEAAVAADGESSPPDAGSPGAPAAVSSGPDGLEQGLTPPPGSATSSSQRKRRRRGGRRLRGPAAASVGGGATDPTDGTSAPSESTAGTSEDRD